MTVAHHFAYLHNTLTYSDGPFDDPIDRTTLEQLVFLFRHHAGLMKRLTPLFHQALLPVHQIVNVFRANAKLHHVNRHAPNLAALARQSRHELRPFSSHLEICLGFCARKEEFCFDDIGGIAP